MLTFFGRSSAFKEQQNSAFFTVGDTLVLIDCPMSSFHLIREAGPDRLTGGKTGRIRVLVTHTHGDHISGIPMLIHYCYYVLHLPVIVVAPSEEVRNDLLFYFDRLEGCHPDGYTLVTAKDPDLPKEDPMRSVILDVIPTKHSPELEGRCFGYHLSIGGRSVIFTGDTGTLEPFLPYLNPEGGDDLYTEISFNPSPVHLYLMDVLDQLKQLSRQGTRVYLMHMDDEAAILDAVRDTGILPAPLYQSVSHKEETIMERESEIMLSDIFSVSEKLYAQMSRTDQGDHDEIFTHLTDLGKILAEADRASFWKWDKDSHTLWTTAATGTDRITIPDTTGLVGKALALGKVVITNDPYNDPDFNSAVDKKTGYVTKSILVMPVANIKGEYIGAYQVINKLGGDGCFHEEEDCRKLSLAAVICGLALESDVFLAESHTDKLTKLKNRMGFFADFRKSYDHVIADPSRKLSLFICDIDKFKSVNDTYGHNAGDEVLKNVARIMQKNTEATDGIYRWGGEEFIMIMVDADMEKAAAKAESIRKEIEGAVCECFGYTIRHTMSFGVTEFDPEKNIEENISVADAKLYTAKESGRNRVII